MDLRQRTAPQKATLRTCQARRRNRPCAPTAASADGTQPARPHPPGEDEAVHTGRRHPHAQREQEAHPMQTRRSGHPPTHDRPSASASKSHLNQSRSHPRIPIDLWMAKTPRPATNFARTHAIDPLPAERQAAALSPCPRTRQAGNDDVHALYDEAIRRRGWDCCLTTWWVPTGPLAVVSALLRQAGSGPVWPLALASAPSGL